ncbi:MAG: CopG family transcriptional regulator, partial [Prevotellaceae bacterium]|nr:CopG family transcriptional regulator [Prevotellaceae bacterium]
MEIIKVNVQWCDNNFGASLSDNVPGSVVFTADTFEKLQKEAEETLRFHIEGMVADGENVPQWLMDGDYKFEFSFLDAP